jgi:hypothetical protein
MKYSCTAPVVSDDPKLPDSLNEFYCRFDKDQDDALIQPTGIKTRATPSVLQEDEVRRLLKKLNGRKAAGHDLVSSTTIKRCADELTPVLTDIFNWSRRECRVPTCFKSAVIIPVPKKPSITGLNDYRPVGLTSVIMKIFEKIKCDHLSKAVSLDPFQFAYRTNRSV